MEKGELEKMGVSFQLSLWNLGWGVWVSMAAHILTLLPRGEVGIPRAAEGEVTCLPGRPCLGGPCGAACSECSATLAPWGES